MKSYGTVIAGGGIIGASLAFELARRGESVLILDRQEPGREASGPQPEQFRQRQTANRQPSRRSDAKATACIQSLSPRSKALRENPQVSTPTARWNYFLILMAKLSEIAASKKFAATALPPRRFHSAKHSAASLPSARLRARRCGSMTKHISTRA